MDGVNDVTSRRADVLTSAIDELRSLLPIKYRIMYVHVYLFRFVRIKIVNNMKFDLPLFQALR